MFFNTHALTGLFAAGLALVSGAASAQCLSAADLGRGIFVTFDNGDTALSRRGADGYLHIEEHYYDSDAYFVFRAHRGVYFVEEFEVDANGTPYAGTHLRTEFPVDPARLPTPAPGGSWSGISTNIFEDGYRRSETTSYEFSAAEPITLSGCTYEVVRTDVSYDWGVEGSMTLYYMFLPALDATILITSHFDGNLPMTAYPVSIELARK